MPDPRDSADSADSAFGRLFDTYSARVFAYARRQVPAEDARDVVADTFLVAWRRRDAVPDDPLPWLLVVARNTVANLRRKHRRQYAAETSDIVDALDRLAPTHGVDTSVTERAELLAALGTLTELEREALLLVAWDGLRNRDAAAVAGCSPRAFEVRLSRARARLERELDTTATATSENTSENR